MKQEQFLFIQMIVVNLEIGLFIYYYWNLCTECFLIEIYCEISCIKCVFAYFIVVTNEIIFICRESDVDV